MENNGKYDKDAEHNVLCPTELEIIGKQLQESREARKRSLIFTATFPPDT